MKLRLKNATNWKFWRIKSLRSCIKNWKLVKKCNSQSRFFGEKIKKNLFCCRRKSNLLTLSLRSKLFVDFGSIFFQLMIPWLCRFHMGLKAVWCLCLLLYSSLLFAAQNLTDQDDWVTGLEILRKENESVTYYSTLERYASMPLPGPYLRFSAAVFLCVSASIEVRRASFFLCCVRWVAFRKSHSLSLSLSSQDRAGFFPLNLSTHQKRAVGMARRWRKAASGCRTVLVCTKDRWRHCWDAKEILRKVPSMFSSIVPDSGKYFGHGKARGKMVKCDRSINTKGQIR